ncbi:MAG: prepilin-type N-terminal cleavage/methylation domain-containing protein [Puniceicoccales bacterium]
MSQIISRTFRRPAFSLVELLAVIAVVAILSALLMTGVGHVRENMASTHCLSNLRRLQMANITYANSNPQRMYVPTFSNGSEVASSGRVLWHSNDAFLPFLEVEKFTDRSNWPPTFWPDEFICPTATVEGGRIDRCYASNWSDMPFGRSYNALGAVAAVRVTDVIRPGEVIAFVDAPNWLVNYPFNEYVGEVTTNNAIGYRHKGKANVVFYDGHVDSYPPEILENTPSMWQISH